MSLRNLPGGVESTRGQRQADALAAMAQDSLDGDTVAEAAPMGPSVAVLIDLDQATASGGELGAEIEYGPRVGLNTLDELLCTGSVQIIGLSDGRPVVTSNAAKAIPPAVRHAVDANNLATLCWYHHHVAIHGQGLRIDPDSAPLRRRLIRSRAGPDPP